MSILSIYIGMILDALDGRVARLTHTASEFGLHYDSLSDMLTFGIAPALVLHEWSLQFLSIWDVGWVRMSWLLAFFYVAAVGFRLARFNALTSTSDCSFFRGLPSPAGAGLLMAALWIADQQGYSGEDLRVPAAILMLVAAGLMVSGFRYMSFKDSDLMRKLHPTTWFALLFVLLLLLVKLSWALLALFGLYALSGPGLYLVQRMHRKPEFPKTSK